MTASSEVPPPVTPEQLAQLQPLTPAQLVPAIAPATAEAVVRPSLSYWRGAWVRLRANRRALWSLRIIVLLLLFSFVLPLLLELDTTTQDLTQISRPPGLPLRSLVVDSAPWEGPMDTGRAPAAQAVAATGAVHGLRLAQAAHTEFVRLAWEPLPGVRGYRVYRHILPPSGRADLGLPLGSSGFSGEAYFEDRLKLRTRTYYYSVVAEDSGGERSAYATLEVRPRHAISLLDAAARGLIDSPDGARFAGTELTLAPHWLGTDYLGRDLLARLAVGGQTSLFIGLVAPLICALFAIVYGGLSGYLGGRLDELLMRFADFVIALPFLLFMILIRVAMGIGPGQSGVVPLLVALVLLGWPSAAKLVRGQVLQLREQPFVDAARLMGARPLYLVWCHMLPNVLGVVLVSLTFAIPSAIFTEAFLSFIGMGVAPPTPSWGAMCNDGVKSFLSHPHELLLPAALISITVLAFNLLGDGLRDALDVRLRS